MYPSGCTLKIETVSSLISWNNQNNKFLILVETCCAPMWLGWYLHQNINHSKYKHLDHAIAKKSNYRMVCMWQC